MRLRIPLMIVLALPSSASASSDKKRIDDAIDAAKTTCKPLRNSLHDCRAEVESLLSILEAKLYCAPPAKFANFDPEPL